MQNVWLCKCCIVFQPTVTAVAVAVARVAVVFMLPSVPKRETKSKTVKKTFHWPLQLQDLKKKTCFSVFLIFEWQFTCLPSSPELRSNMQHSVPYNNLKKVNGWCKQILPKLMLRIYSIMYLQISFLHIPGIPEVILSLRILWTPKTTVWKVPHPSHHPCLLSSGPSHERIHPCECHHHHHPTNRRVPLLGGGFNPLKKY